MFLRVTSMTSSVERTDSDFKISVALVYTVCHSVCTIWTHNSMVNPHCSIFRMITAIFLGVQIFRNFTVTVHLSFWGCRFFCFVFFIFTIIPVFNANSVYPDKTSHSEASDKGSILFGGPSG